MALSGLGTLCAKVGYNKLEGGEFVHNTLIFIHKEALGI